MSFTRWTPEMVAELRAHVAENKLFMKEIAERMGLKPTVVLHKCRKLGIRTNPPGRFAEWNVKHKHLREPAMKYFLTHSLEETRKHFGLTHSEVGSLFRVAYRDPSLKHLRKDDRCHDAWELDQVLFVLRHVGVRPGEWIAKSLRRGKTRHGVKDLLENHCSGAQSRYLNGMPLSLATAVFGEQVRTRVIKTKAGPRGNSRADGKVRRRCDFAYKLLPWIEAEELLDRGLTRQLKGSGRWSPERALRAPRLKVSRDVEKMIRALAQFQRWLHGVETTRQIRSRIQAALKGR